MFKHLGEHPGFCPIAGIGFKDCFAIWVMMPHDWSLSEPALEELESFLLFESPSPLLILFYQGSQGPGDLGVLVYEAIEEVGKS